MYCMCHSVHCTALITCRDLCPFSAGQSRLMLGVLSLVGKAEYLVPCSIHHCWSRGCAMAAAGGRRHLGFEIVRVASDVVGRSRSLSVRSGNAQVR